MWHRDGQPLMPETLSAMSAAIAHRGRDGAGQRVAGSIGLACQHFWNTPEEHGETQPLEGATGAMLVMDGRLDNRDEIIAALGLSPRLSDATCVLAAYDAWDDRFADRLNGDFAIAIFDKAKQRLLLVRDAIGIRPLYYYSDARMVAFASEIKALLAHPAIPAQPDDEGLADFMFVAARPLDRQELTCFRGISAVVPAHVGIFTRERAITRRYWDFDTGRTIRLRGFDEYVDAFAERFTQAVTRRSRSRYPVAVSVSGGLDSSSIFCQAEALRQRGILPSPAVAGVSYVTPDEENDERRYQHDIERKYGVEIERFPMEPFIGLARGFDEQIRAIESPFVDYQWGVTRELYRRASARGARTLLSGHWGDQVLFSSAYLVDLFNRFQWRMIRQHTREFARYFGADETRVLERRFLFAAAKHHVPTALRPPLKWLRLRLFPPHAPKTWYSDAFLSNALRFRHRVASPGDFHSAHAQSIYVEARSKYHVHCMEWNNKAAAANGLDAAFPFLDRDLLSFLMAVPGEVHAQHGVPRALLREAMRGVLPETVRARTWKSDFTRIVNRGIDQDAALILRTLSKDSLGVRLGYFDEARLEPALAGLASRLGRPDCLDGWDLADTFGFEVWLQLFSLHDSQAKLAEPVGKTPLS